jgi:hypothetical protein
MSEVESVLAAALCLPTEARAAVAAELIAHAKRKPGYWRKR